MTAFCLEKQLQKGLSLKAEEEEIFTLSIFLSQMLFHRIPQEKSSLEGGFGAGKIANGENVSFVYFSLFKTLSSKLLTPIRGLQNLLMGFCYIHLCATCTASLSSIFFCNLFHILYLTIVMKGNTLTFMPIDWQYNGSFFFF